MEKRNVSHVGAVCLKVRGREYGGPVVMGERRIVVWRRRAAEPC